MSTNCGMKIIIMGSMPVKSFTHLERAMQADCRGCGKQKRCLALDSQHPISRRHGATFVICCADDPEIKL